MREKGISLTLGENETFSERVRSYPCHYDKTSTEHKEKDVVVENAWEKVAEKFNFIENDKQSVFLAFDIVLVFFI